MKRSTRYLSIASLIAGLCTAPARGNDTVEELRGAMDQLPESSATSSPPPAKPTKPKAKPQQVEGYDPSRPTSDDDGESVGIGELLGFAALGGLALSSPVWVPGTLVNNGESHAGWFTRYPYQHHDSYMTFEQPRADDPEPWEPGLWSFRLESDYGTNFADQQLFGGHLLFEHVNRFGMEARVNFLEDDFANRANDSLMFGDVNATYRFAHSHHWLFRGGVGMNWLADQGDEDFGANATYQIDWFPTKPLVFSTDIDVGTLGDAWLFHFQQTAGVTWRGLEARVGYDYLDVGDAQFSLFLCGVRGWF